MTSTLGIGLVNSHTLMGRDVKAILKERAFPVGKVALFHTGSREGILSQDEDEAVYISALTTDSLEGCRVAFVCSDPDGVSRFLGSRSADGCLLIDLSGLRTGGPQTWEGEPDRLPSGATYLTYEPNARVLYDLVAALEKLRPVASLTAAIDRPASELGMRALEELFQQAVALASFKPLPKEVLGTQSAFAVYDPPDTERYEEAVTQDLRRLLGRELPVTLLTARAGVFHGHYIRAEALFDGPAPDAEEIRKVLFGTDSAFDEVDPENLSGPVEAAGRDETLVLSIRSNGNSARLNLAADHLRRAGALMGVRLAERAIVERGLLADG